MNNAEGVAAILSVNITRGVASDRLATRLWAPGAQARSDDVPGPSDEPGASDRALSRCGGDGGCAASQGVSRLVPPLAAECPRSESGRAQKAAEADGELCGDSGCRENEGPLGACGAVRGQIVELGGAGCTS